MTNGILNILTYINKSPIAQFSKKDIEIIDLLVEARLENTNIYQLIMLAVNGDFKKLKEECMINCYDDFLFKGDYYQYYQKSRNDKIVSTCLLANYYNHRHKNQKAKFYLTLSKYLESRIILPLRCNVDVKYKQQPKPNQKTIASPNTTTNNEPVTPNTPNTPVNEKRFDEFIDYYSDKMETHPNGQIIKWLSYCTDFFNNIHQNYRKRHENMPIPTSSQFFTVAQQLSALYNKYQQWDNYCLFAAKILLLGSSDPVQPIIGNLLEVRTLINKEVWSRLPFYMSAYDDVITFCQNSNLYDTLMRNNNIIDPKTIYILKVVVYMWSLGLNLYFLKDDPFRPALLNCANGDDRQLFYIIILLSLPELLVSYKNRITLKGNTLALVLVEYSSCNLFDGLQFEENIFINRETFEKNVNCLCKHSNVTNGIFNRVATKTYIFWVMLETSNKTICPSQYFIEGMADSPISERLIITDSDLLLKVEMAMAAWQHLHNKYRNRSAIDTPSPDFHKIDYRTHDGLSLKKVAELLNLINSSKEGILDETSGIDYITTMKHFENISNKSSVTETLTSAHEPLSSLQVDKFYQNLRQIVVIGKYGKYKSLSDSDHLLFVCLNGLDDMCFVSEQYKIGTLSILPILIENLRKIASYTDFAEIAAYYSKHMFYSMTIQPKGYPTKSYQDEQLDLLKNILLKECTRTHCYEGILTLYNWGSDSTRPFRFLGFCEPNIREYLTQKLLAIEEVGIHMGYSDIHLISELRRDNSNCTIDNIATHYDKFENQILEMARLRPPSKV